MHTIEIRIDRVSLTPFSVIERQDGIEVKSIQLASLTEAERFADHWAVTYGAKFLGRKGF